MLQIASNWERRIPPLVWSDRVTNAEQKQRTNTNDIVAAAHILKCEWEKPCGTNGPAHTDTRYTNVGHKNGQNKNVATEDQMGKFVKESSGKTTATRSQKPVRMEYTYKTSVKATSPGISQPVVKHSRSPWFNQQVVAFKALTRLIYFNIYLFIPENVTHCSMVCAV
jgi:hypothetical protein